MLKTIILSGREVTYDMQIKNVKNLNLRIKPDGSLHLSVNKYVSQSTVEEFLSSNTTQIINALDKFKNLSENLPKAIKYENGDTVPFLGEKLSLVVKKGEDNSAVNINNSLVLTVKDISDFALKEKTVELWYSLMAESILKEICQRVYPDFSHACKEFPKLRFRKMRSMWGNCRHNQRILTFNTNLVKYPLSAIEYVVYHEFTHFIHQNHSESFYSELEKYVPDWKIRKQMLKNK